MYTTSGTLLERLRSRVDDGAWERFVVLYTPFLYHCGRRYGLDETDAADAVQDVFVQLLVKLPLFQMVQGGSFRGWLKTVLLNKCRERHRGRHDVTLGASADRFSGIVDDTGLEAWWESEYRQHLVSRALNIMRTDFEPATWQACWQHVVEERPVCDVARDLGLSTATVYTYCSRVLKRLRSELQELMD